MKCIHEKIKALRIKNNISQASMADTLGVSRSCLSNWENGIRTPKAKYIYKYISEFNLPNDYFSDDKITQTPNTLSMDISKFNSSGIKKLYDYYDHLLSDEENLKKY